MKRHKSNQSKGRSSQWRRARPRPEQGPESWYITGLHGVRACLLAKTTRIHQVWADPGKVPDELHPLLAALGEKVVRADGRETNRGPLLQGIAILVSPPEWPEVSALVQKSVEDGRQPLLVALDQVEDPMNLGQILRTCEGAGVDAVLLPKHRSTGLNETAARVSQGAFAWLPTLEIGNLRQALEDLKALGLWVVGCDTHAGSQPWYKVDLTVPTVVVMGAEGRGLRDLTRKTCDHLVHLTMHGRTESLNVGAATSAILYEVLRQRSAP